MANILIIEDDEDIRRVLKKILETDGHKVTVAPNGKVGIEVYREERNDIVITDMIMPDMEGVETILHIRSDCPDAKIIAISGGGPSRKRVNVFDYRADSRRDQNTGQAVRQ